MPLHLTSAHENLRKECTLTENSVHGRGPQSALEVALHHFISSCTGEQRRTCLQASGFFSQKALSKGGQGQAIFYSSPSWRTADGENHSYIENVRFIKFLGTKIFLRQV